MCFKRGWGGLVSPPLQSQYNAPVFRPSVAAVTPSVRWESLFPPSESAITWSWLGSQSRQQQGSRTTGITPARIWSFIETENANTDGIKSSLLAGCERRNPDFCTATYFEGGKDLRWSFTGIAL